MVWLDCIYRGCLVRRAICVCAAFVGLAAHFAAAGEIPFVEIACAGHYAKHLQGACSDGATALYWCFTTELVKTDLRGRGERTISVANHHGDLCFHDGKVYSAVNLGKFNRPAGEANSWVYVYDAADLTPLGKHAVPEVVHGAGGMAYHNGKFLIVGGLPPGVDENYAYEYDAKFRFLKRHILRSGYTLMGIQTAAFADGRWWFGCYGAPKILLVADRDLQNVRRFEFDASLGIVPVDGKRLLVARGATSKAAGHAARLVPATADEQRGLVLQPPTAK